MVELPFLSARQLIQASQRLGDELLDFRDRVLPWLVEAGGSERGAFARAAEVMANNINRLSWSLAGLPDPTSFEELADSAPTWDRVHEAIRSTHAVQHPTAQMHLLRRRTVTEEELAACRWDDQRVVWSLWAMVLPWPTEVLDERSRLIAKWLGVEVYDTDDLRRVLRNLSAQRLLRAFRRMPFDTYYLLAETLVRIDPEVPDTVLLVPTGKYGPAASTRATPDWPGVMGPVSYYLGK